MITLEKVCFAYEHEVALRLCESSYRKGRVTGNSGTEWMRQINAYQLLNGIIFPSEGHYLYKGHEITEKR